MQINCSDRAKQCIAIMSVCSFLCFERFKLASAKNVMVPLSDITSVNKVGIIVPLSRRYNGATVN